LPARASRHPPEYHAHEIPLSSRRSPIVGTVRFGRRRLGFTLCGCGVFTVNAVLTA
jgi:hypothetical protein